MKILTCILCLSLVTSPLPAQTAGPTIQEQVLQLPVGSLVEVRLKDKRKLRGRMGTAGADGFSLQHAQNDKIADEQVAFASVKSIKGIESGMKSSTKIILGSVAGAGATVFVILLVLATSL